MRYTPLKKFGTPANGLLLVLMGAGSAGFAVLDYRRGPGPQVTNVRRDYVHVDYVNADAPAIVSTAYKRKKDKIRPLAGLWTYPRMVKTGGDPYLQLFQHHRNVRP